MRRVSVCASWWVSVFLSAPTARISVPKCPVIGSNCPHTSSDCLLVALPSAPSTSLPIAARSAKVPGFSCSCTQSPSPCPLAPSLLPPPSRRGWKPLAPVVVVKSRLFVDQLATLRVQSSDQEVPVELPHVQRPLPESVRQLRYCPHQLSESRLQIQHSLLQLLHCRPQLPCWMPDLSTCRQKLFYCLLQLLCSQSHSPFVGPKCSSVSSNFPAVGSVCSVGFTSPMPALRG